MLTDTYDAFGNLHEAKHTDWNNATLKDVTTSYDSLGRPTSESESVSGRTHTWTYPQNAATGNQETISYDATPLTSTQLSRSARGVETSRVTTIASGTTVSRAVADDANGRDTADRWTSATVQLSGFGALTLGRSFDNAGHVASQSGACFASGNSASYTYSSTRGLQTGDSLPLALGGTISDSYGYAGGGACLHAPPPTAYNRKTMRRRGTSESRQEGPIHVRPRALVLGLLLLPPRGDA